MNLRPHGSQWGVSGSYQVFARKYRPRTFDEVLGQDHVVQTLKNAILQDRLAHAYLFVGPRGTGKTSTARIFAKALNCTNGPRIDFDPDEDVCIEIAEGRSLDVLEIDGASNNGVEQVRELRENVRFAPARGQFRIYYIDEVHMLTSGAFNALLKTLEEPPVHVKFIFATTEPHKILPTILSRCQRFDLRRIPTKVIADHLLHIAREEGVQLSDAAAHTVARGAEGGMRDAQSMLDQLVAFCGNQIELQHVLDVFGFTAHETIQRLAGSLIATDNVAALGLLHEQQDAGRDLSRLLADLMSHIRTLLVAQVDPAAATAELADDEAAELVRQSKEVKTDQLLRLIDVLAAADARMKWAPNKLLHFEIAVIQATQALNEVSLEDVVRFLTNALEKSGGIPPQPTIPGATAAQPPVVATVRTGPDVPATPTPEPAPEAKADALNAPAEGAAAPVDATATETQDIDPSVLWNDSLGRLAKERPMLTHWAKLGQVLSSSDLIGASLVVGFPKSASPACDQMSRPNIHKEIEAIVGDVAGRPIRVRFEVDPSLPDPEPEPIVPQSSGSGDERPADAPAAAPGEPRAVDAEEDPLIEAAMRLFKARLA